MPQTVAVGGTLDVTLPNIGLGTNGLSYTITPQPLPANMSFNRQTGELTFQPAPGQQGQLSFSVLVSSALGSGTITLPLTVNSPAVATTEVSGQVVDENGNPLAGMPVTIDHASTVTDSIGDFTLTGISTNPGPISAGGALGTAQGRLDLTAPVAQLMGHAVYANANNVIASPLILPEIHWSSSASFSQTSVTSPLDITNSAMPGFDIQIPAGSANTAPVSGTLSLAVLPASESFQHMSPGVGGGLLLYKVTGVNLTQPVQLTIPNTGGLKPGATVFLSSLNPITGGHDDLGQMVVSSDGKTMTSQGPVILSSFDQSSNAGTGSGSGPSPDDPIQSGGVGCLEDSEDQGQSNPNTECASCQLTAGGLGIPTNSNIGLVTGEYFQDHQLVTYQSQGQNVGIDLQYSSAQATAEYVAQYQVTTPLAGDSSSITSISAVVSLAGVVQGTATTYTPPGGFSDGTTYYIPLQVNASSLATGVYSYTMTITETYGSGSGATTNSTVGTGYVNVVNLQSDSLGSGWSVGGLQQLSQVATNGPVLITDGQQADQQFDPVYNSGQSYYQDLAVASSTSTAQVLTNDGTGHFTSSGTPSTSGVVGSATADFNGDGKPDLAVLSSSTLSILLNNGSGGFTAGSSYSLPSGEIGTAIAVGNFTGHTNSTKDIAVLLTATGAGEVYDEIAIYTGNGDGTFQTPVVTTIPIYTYTTTGQLAVADFNGDGKSDLAADIGQGGVAILIAGTGGSMTVSSLSLPSGQTGAYGVATVDYNGDSHPDLVVAAGGPDYDTAGYFVSLDLYEGNGTGTLTYESTDQLVGHTATDISGITAGDFQGSAFGTEVAVPIQGDTSAEYIEISPLSTSGTWSSGVVHPLGNTAAPAAVGNIISGDFNGAGKPSIAVTDGSGNLYVLLADPASNQFMPMQTISVGSSGTAWSLTSAPFAQDAATSSYRGPTSDPSTLVHNSNGTWTRTYPDGTVFQFNSSGQETSEADSNGNTFSYAYISSGAAAGSLYTITDPVGLITTLAYNSSGDLITVLDPDFRTTTFTINSYDNLVSIQDPTNAVVTYGYSTPSNHLITTETNSDGNSATANYNSFGQVTSENLFGGIGTTAVTSAQSNSLLAPGGSGALSTSYSGSVTDPDGNMTTLTFNWMSHPTMEVNGDGGVTNITYNYLGFPVTVTDPMDRTTTYQYDFNGNVTKITQPDGSSETIVYNEEYGVPTSITDFDGNTTTYTLDSHGNVLDREDPDGLTEVYTYNSAGQMLTDKNPNGNTTTYMYDSAGHLTTIIYPGTGTPTYKYTYDGAGNVKTMTDANGNVTTYTYDSAGRMLTSQNPIQAASGEQVTYRYDSAGNLTSVTDANNQTTSYTYNARNELISETDPVNHVTGLATRYTYDAYGNLITVSDPLGYTTTYSYNRDNEETGMIDGDGNRTTYVYDLADELTEVIDPNGNTTTYTYNNIGLLESETLPGTAANGSGTQVAVTTTYSYDHDGDLLTSTDALGHTTSYTYDSMDREKTMKDAAGDITTYTYDGDSNLVSEIDPLGHITTYGYDARDNEITETDPGGGGTTTYTYDGDNNLISVTDPDNNITTYQYDSANRVTTVTSPIGHTTYTYDLMNNETGTTDADGRTINYTYDGDNNETSETWVNPAGGSAIDLITYTYNGDGELTKAADDNATYEYTYNGDGEVISQSTLGSADLPTVTLTYSYDGDGNRTSMDDSLGGLTSYTYDVRDDLATITFSGTSLTAERADYVYDAAGRMTTMTVYSNLAGTTEFLGGQFSYDSANRLTSIVYNNLTTVNRMHPNGTTVASYHYTYDSASRVVTEVRNWASGSSTDTLNYTYTNNNQLTGVTHTNSSFANQSFTWDANGNQTGTGYTTSSDNEQTASPGYTYAYDSDGNMTTMTQTSTGDVWTYTYNYRNQMTGATEKSSTGTLLSQTTYTYDGVDSRIGIDENGTQTWTLFDGGSDPVMDFNSSGSLTMRYLNGPIGDLVDAVLSRQSSGGTVIWYLPDRLGTIRDLMSTSGSIIDHVDYGAFGNQLDESSPSSGDRIMGFAGLQRDTTVGINLAVHRAQDPSNGRWTSEDRLGFAAGDRNLYRYAGNDATGRIDPSGLQAPVVGGGGITFGGNLSGGDISIGIGPYINWNGGGHANLPGGTIGPFWNYSPGTGWTFGGPGLSPSSPDQSPSWPTDCPTQIGSDPYSGQWPLPWSPLYNPDPPSFPRVPFWRRPGRIPLWKRRWSPFRPR